jgi:hypothetical protein
MIFSIHQSDKFVAIQICVKPKFEDNTVASNCEFNKMRMKMFSCRYEFKKILNSINMEYEFSFPSYFFSIHSQDLSEEHFWN